MTYWTVMWITIMGGMLDGETTSVAYPSLDSCEAALASGSIQPQQRPTPEEN